MPFLDLDYVKSLLRLPPRVRDTTKVHRHLLAHARIPRSYGLPMATTERLRGAGDVVQRISRKCHQWVKRFTGYERFKHYVDVPGWLRSTARAVRRSLLDPANAETAACCEPDAVRVRTGEITCNGRADRRRLCCC